tara:strand:- start:25423 stop:27150 length:1728 start_codon:yes stop_codon:yes gene_type:complete
MSTSVTAQWNVAEPDQAQVDSLKNALSVGPVLASLLVQMGYEDADQARQFLEARLADLDDPFAIKHVREAVERIRQAMREGESVCVMGDYDVDGVTSTTLLISVLRLFGLDPRAFMPLRLEEGYGLSRVALKRLFAEGRPDLLIVADSGTNSVEEVAFLRTQGVDVIIIDHHRSKEKTPEDCILINPHVNDSQEAPWLHLCSVGLAFKVAHGLVKALREEGDPQAHEVRVKDTLDLVALGTVADLMPLQKENRILVKHGLDCLAKSPRPGIHALFRVSGMELGQPVLPMDISYKLGPRINASGRLADALLPIEMLLSEDSQVSFKAAKELDVMNRERQEIERQIWEEAQAAVEADQLEEPGIVLHNPNWHSGVVGIVAGKLCRHYQRPCIVLGQEGAFAKGSGRSVPGINLVEVLQHCDGLLESWGGHPMAVGVVFKPADYDVFRERFSEAVKHSLEGGLPEKILSLAYWLSPEQVDAALLEELDRLHPFGEKNAQPIFGIRGARLLSPPKCFGRNHYRFQIETQPGQSVWGVAWGKADALPPCGKPIELAVKMAWNVWNGRRSIQLELIDWRCS